MRERRDVLIRDLTGPDESAWLDLWHGYCAFYETDVAEEVTSATWQRILDPDSAVVGRIADIEGVAVGFSVSVVHPSTWTLGPVCYLEDLYVAPESRSSGVGRQLVSDLVALGERCGWARLYWHTRADNPARRLYDEFVAADNFVRYLLTL